MGRTSDVIQRGSGLLLAALRPSPRHTGKPLVIDAGPTSSAWSRPEGFAKPARLVATVGSVREDPGGYVS